MEKCFFCGKDVKDDIAMDVKERLGEPLCVGCLVKLMLIHKYMDTRSKFKAERKKPSTP